MPLHGTYTNGYRVPRQLLCPLICYARYVKSCSTPSPPPRTWSRSPSVAFLTLSSTLLHCSIMASLGAAKKKLLLKVPRHKTCWRSLYSKPSSRLMHSRRSITLRGGLEVVAAFWDLWHSRVLLARKTMYLWCHFWRKEADGIKTKINDSNFTSLNVKLRFVSSHLYGAVHMHRE